MNGSGQGRPLYVCEWSGGPPGCPRVVGRPSRMLLVFGRPSRIPGVVGRLPDAGSVRETLLDVREWSEGPPSSQGVVGRPSRMSGSGREALPYVR